MSHDGHFFPIVFRGSTVDFALPSPPAGLFFAFRREASSAAASSRASAQAARAFGGDDLYLPKQ
jgi:hypothetical protein